MAIPDDEMIHLAFRARALTLSLATTGSTSLSATATGYARTAGSFITDGFVVGQEVTPAGFASNTVGSITALTALAMTINGGRPAEAAAGSRSLTILLPSDRAWENIAFNPTTGRPYISEQYVPGTNSQQTYGPGGDIVHTGFYQLQVNVPAANGISADGRYAKGILALFPPRYALTLSTGDVVRVNWDPAPYRGQRLQPEPGWSVIPVSVPFILRTQNSI